MVSQKSIKNPQTLQNQGLADTLFYHLSRGKLILKKGQEKFG